VLLAELPVPERGHRPKAEVAFVALRTEGVMDGRLCARLIKAQRARSRIEHTYLDLTAGRCTARHDSSTTRRRAS
jgi:hypothetical protein